VKGYDTTPPEEDLIRDFDKERLGLFAEALWSAVFWSCELLSYIPLHRIETGQAPSMRGQGQDVVLPDFELSTNRLAAYVDSKGKKHPVLYRVASEWRHGIERRHHAHYTAISERSQKHCFLAVFECFADEENSEWSGALLVQSLVRLGKPCEGYSTMNTTVFWPRARFHHLANLTAAQAFSIVDKKAKVPVEVGLSLYDFVCENAGKPLQGRLF
jgi:hypothetical protein